MRPYIPTPREALFQDLVREQRARDRYEARMAREVDASRTDARRLAKERRERNLRYAGRIAWRWALGLSILAALIWCAGP